MPRFQGENYDRNIKLVEKLQEIAAEKECSAAQLSLAWLMAQGEDIVQIPGTRRQDRLDENLAAIELTLSSADLERIGSLVPLGAAAGARYPDTLMHTVNA